jgi:uncharacterized protein YecT (DUF1311 family)
MNHTDRHRAFLRAVAAVLILLPALAFAQQPCTDPDCEAAAVRAGPPLPERLRTLDEGLQQEHDELVRQVNDTARDRGRLAAALKAQQSAWLQYRDATCALAGTLSGAPVGTTSTRTLQCRAEWAEAQRLRLWAALDCIGQVPPAERALEQERCLLALVASQRP